MIAQSNLCFGLCNHVIAQRKADTIVNNVVAALDQFLGAWERLPSPVPEAQVAAASRQVLFPDDTAFLKLPFGEEWAQIERQVTRLKSQSIDKQIAKLGGPALVTHREESHAAYGKALGLTAVPAAPAETVTVRSPLSTPDSALRTFVIKVTAYHGMKRASATTTDALDLQSEQSRSKQPACTPAKSSQRAAQVTVATQATRAGSHRTTSDDADRGAVM